jgi:hypothetical protein
MVYLADSEDMISSQKRLLVIGMNKCDGNNFKVVQSTSVKVGRYDKILSKSLTSTNHLVVTFTNGSALMMYLDNFRDLHFKHAAANDSIVVASNDFLLGATSTNVGLAHFTEFFLV